MIVAELATYRLPADPAFPAPMRDILWRARHFMCEDLVRLYTDCSARCYNSMAWSSII
jgi:hypothetical protein